MEVRQLAQCSCQDKLEARESTILKPLAGDSREAGRPVFKATLVPDNESIPFH
jgi:hypothetical protein